MFFNEICRLADQLKITGINPYEKAKYSALLVFTNDGAFKQVRDARITKESRNNKTYLTDSEGMFPNKVDHYSSEMTLGYAAFQDMLDYAEGMKEKEAKKVHNRHNIFWQQIEDAFNESGEPALKYALEFKKQNEKTNVMLRDLGALADFGQANLDESDYALVEDADYVCLFNWAGTLKFGTELAQVVFDRAKRIGKGKT